MICGFCKEDARSLNKDGFCRTCGPIIKKGRELSGWSMRQRSEKIRPAYQKLRRLAVSQVAIAVRSGRLPKVSTGEQPCVDCGSPASGYDHRDYRKPLDVVAVCTRCNVRRGPGKPHPRAYKRPQEAAP